MELIDTHSHIYYDKYDDIDEVINRALKNDVQLCFLPNIDRSTVAAMNLLSDQYPDHCFPMMGLHPCSVSENFKNELKHIEGFFSERKYSSRSSANKNK